MVKHDDWRSAAPFFEVVAAKLQGPSLGPETLAWPPNYHYGGSPFRARSPLLGTKLLGRGPVRSPSLYPPLGIFSHPPLCVSCRPLSRSCSIVAQMPFSFFFPVLSSIRPAFINIFVARLATRKRLCSQDNRELDEIQKTDWLTDRVCNCVFAIGMYDHLLEQKADHCTVPISLSVLGGFS